MRGEGVEVKLHPFVTSSLDVGQRSATHHCRLIHGESTPPFPVSTKQENVSLPPGLYGRFGEERPMWESNWNFLVNEPVVNSLEALKCPCCDANHGTYSEIVKVFIVNLEKAYYFVSPEEQDNLIQKVTFQSNLQLKSVFL